MSTQPAKHLFFVYAPDYTDAEAFPRRMSVRTKHLSDAQPHLDSGYFKVAGGILTEDSIKPGAERKLIGSTFIVEAETLEQVRKTFEADIYWEKDVWDKEKLVIQPMLAAKI